MALVKQGGGNPYVGQVMTTAGYKSSRPPLCMVCGERRPGQLYTKNGYGQDVCADCASPHDREILKADTDAGEVPTWDGEAAESGQ